MTWLENTFYGRDILYDRSCALDLTCMASQSYFRAEFYQTAQRNDC